MAPLPVRQMFDRGMLWVTGSDPATRCWHEVREGSGHSSFRFDQARECYRFASSRRYSGVFVDEFEGPRFLDGAVGLPPYRVSRAYTLEIDRFTQGARLGDLRVRPPGQSRLWRITFVGRQAIGTARTGPRRRQDGIILADRVESAELLSVYRGYLIGKN
ncbi:hypothetical protein [Novosphingobium sp.]|uniref:hypothetical protein n=1 Tax=Novosphingobium sp. TaxID=1874826 RepID=UPI002639B7C2|nr:hypothetical protein [Novosphingobium sp.]